MLLEQIESKLRLNVLNLQRENVFLKCLPVLLDEF